eukprot:2763499-Rhodomonas_salina.3
MCITTRVAQSPLGTDCAVRRPTTGRTSSLGRSHGSWIAVSPMHPELRTSSPGFDPVYSTSGVGEPQIPHA